MENRYSCVLNVWLVDVGFWDVVGCFFLFGWGFFVRILRNTFNT